MSQRMLEAINDYVLLHGRLIFMEYLFPTISVENNFTMYSPPEFEYITWRKWVDDEDGGYYDIDNYGGDQTCDRIEENSMHWFHPVKNLSTIQSCYHGYSNE